jgi:hypothetical protein
MIILDPEECPATTDIVIPISGPTIVGSGWVPIAQAPTGEEPNEVGRARLFLGGQISLLFRSVSSWFSDDLLTNQTLLAGQTVPIPVGWSIAAEMSQETTQTPRRLAWQGFIRPSPEGALQIDIQTDDKSVRVFRQGGEPKFGALENSDVISASPFARLTADPILVAIQLLIGGLIALSASFSSFSAVANRRTRSQAAST